MSLACLFLHAGLPRGRRVAACVTRFGLKQNYTEGAPMAGPSWLYCMALMH